MKSKKLEIEIPEGKTAVWRNGILTLIDEPEKDVRKRIKTFEDACHEIGIDAEAWNRDKISLGLEPDVLAFLKLRIIVKALNEAGNLDLQRMNAVIILGLFFIQGKNTISWTRKKSLVWCVGRTAARTR